MKKLIAFFMAAWWPLAVTNATLILRGPPVAAGAVVSSYWFDERFEPTGGANGGYTNAWTEAGTGTIEQDYATSPPQGFQALQISGTTQNPRSTFTLPVDVTEFWGFCKFRVDTAISANRLVLQISDTGGTATGGFTLVSSAGSPPNTLTARNGTTNATTTVTGLTAGADYNIWFHWKKGSGANGIGSVGFDVAANTTEITSGNQFSSVTGNAVVDAHSITVGFPSNTTGAFVIDMILLSNTATIGNNPT